MSAWASFWLCLAVYIAAEAVMYLQGHETVLWKHKTPAELEIQRQQIEKRAAPTTGDTA